jgi:methionyl aminopeptidase
VTRESLLKGIEAARPGNRVGDISYAIQHYCEKQHGYGVVRELVGHGVGKSLHEDPEVPNFGLKGKGPLLKEGMVLAIEPMVNLGNKAVKQMDDGWTILTRDGKASAHFEHSVAVKTDGPDILSDHSFVDEAVKKNEELVNISINF